MNYCSVPRRNALPTKLQPKRSKSNAAATETSAVAEIAAAGVSGCLVVELTSAAADLVALAAEALEEEADSAAAAE